MRIIMRYSTLFSMTILLLISCKLPQVTQSIEQRQKTIITEQLVDTSIRIGSDSLLSAFQYKIDSGQLIIKPLWQFGSSMLNNVLQVDSIHKMIYINTTKHDTLNMQGLEQSNKLTPLISMLIKVGKTGETVGTSLTKIFSMGIAKKQFNSINGMFDWLAKNSNEKINEIFGGGDDAQTALLLKNMGMKEYLKTIESLNNQGNLDERVNNSLNTLTNTAEAMGGAIKSIFLSLRI